MARLSYPPRAGRRKGSAGSPDALALTIAERARGRERLIVAIAGPPGAGKSTLAEALLDALTAQGETAAIVPMDGFHYDDRVLAARGLLPRKGAPETFDVAGFAVLLDRLAAREADIAIPVFDRTIEISRAGAAIVGRDVRIILAEGNYLLLDEAPWRDLGRRFDLTILLKVPIRELERRLVRRWLNHDHTPDEAQARALSNDIPNARRVIEASIAADIVV